MGLREIICGFFDCDRECFESLKVHEKKIAELNDHLKVINNAKNMYHEIFQKTKTQLKKAMDIAGELEKENSLLKSQLGAIFPKLPEAEITYKRPVLVSKKKWIQSQIDVRNFIMPDFEMRKELEAKQLTYTGKEDLDDLIPKIYIHARRNFRYGPDSDYGFDEYWMFPFELKAVLGKKKAGDCDDWANLIGSYMASAGIPRTQWLVSAGYTRNRIGHATFYAKDSTGEWRHLNSTNPWYRETTLEKYPSKDNQNDALGIKKDGFWFSYNDVVAIHKFESTEARSTFKKQKLPITIRRKKK